ncbi:MAG: aminotransferase class V-fold PLP-dependent enzyme, partial [Cellvibrionaceae bacterium]|nr:aminotransferase class V-fold PLP-dependent enzyme [Cellvibrionaceae bacterium]
MTPNPSPFAVANLRAQFPVFQSSQNQNLVYLDNAATAQKPEPVIEAMADYYR